MYRFFDLLIESELELPWLAEAAGPQADWSVVLGSTGEGFTHVHAWSAPEGPEVMRVARRGDGYLLEFPRLARFELDFVSRRIVAEPAAGCSEDSLAHLLLDQALPRAVCHEGRCVIHAGAVEIGGGAVAFTGVTGTGKSTLAAAFHSAGCAVMTDDCLLIEPAGEGARALAAYPSLRLWPDSANAIYDGAEQARMGVTAVAHYSRKRALSPSTPSRALPLRALCMLQPGAPRGGRRGGVALEPVRGTAAVMTLVEAQFTLDPVDRAAVTRGFEAVRRIAGRVPVLSLSYPKAYEALPEVVATVLESRAIERARAAAKLA